MIKISANCGMCFGAKNAYYKVIKLLENKSSESNVFLYKKLLHNNDVIKNLKERGAVFSDELPSVFGQNDIIIIRTHGETEEFFELLQKKGLSYVDCTCQKVKKIHSLISRKFKEEQSIIIIGDKNHAEVIGSNGWCGNRAVIVSKPEDVDKIDCATLSEKILVIAQTTFNKKMFKLLSCGIAAKAEENGKTLEIFNSLCDAQLKIQNEAGLLASRCETMIVIGSKESANTQQLYKECKNICPNTLLVEERGEFNKVLFNGKTIDFTKNIGITGGASSPQNIINECKQFLEWTSFYKNIYPEIKSKITDMCAYLNNSNDIINRVLSHYTDIALSNKAKYIRGALISMGYIISRKMRSKKKYDIKNSLALCALYELLETGILVHDDVFDNAEKRRGVTTIQNKLKDFYKKASGKNRKINKTILDSSNAAAVCAGDIIFYFVNKKLIEAYGTNKNLFKVLSLLQDIVATTIKGELLDILMPLDERFNIKHKHSTEHYVLLIDKMKTAEYTTIGPLCLGMMLAGAKDEDTAQIQKFALHLGLAFQMKDDLLDIFSDSEYGKNCGADISEYKITMLYALCCREPETKSRLLEHYGKKSNKHSLSEVRRVMEESGAKETLEKEIRRHLDECKKILGGIDFVDEECKNILYGFIIYLELRSM